MQLWAELAAEFGAESFEFERKGGVIVAKTAAALDALRDRGRSGAPEWRTSRRRGRAARARTAARTGFAGGVFYPADAQVQPMLAAARLLQAAIARARAPAR